MRILLAIVGICVLCTAGTPAESVLDDKAAWREACKVSGYSCAWISPPQVVLAPIGALLGRYKMGDKYILVNESVSGSLAYAVRVHEMTHVLQWKHKKWDFTKAGSCKNEHEAFEVSNTVLKRLGNYRDVVDWDKMRVVYGCPL